MEKIIRASSNPGDLVLDPFCGCATACIAAEKPGRAWIGIDIAPQAAEVLTDRARRELQMPLNEGGGKGWEDWTPLILRESPKRADGLTLQSPTDPQSDKALLYADQKGRCVDCEYGLPMHVLTIDHITPRLKGGQDAIGNLQPLCHTCSAIKGSRGMEYLKSRLRAKGITAGGRA